MAQSPKMMSNQIVFFFTVLLSRMNLPSQNCSFRIKIPASKQRGFDLPFYSTRTEMIPSDRPLDFSAFLSSASSTGESTSTMV